MVVYLAIEIEWECGDYADPPRIAEAHVFQSLDEAMKSTYHVIELDIKTEVSFTSKLITYKW